MHESQLFMSSLSRRQLARRRPGRSARLLWQFAVATVVVATVVVALMLAHGIV